MTENAKSLWWCAVTGTLAVVTIVIVCCCGCEIKPEVVGQKNSGSTSQPVTLTAEARADVKAEVRAALMDYDRSIQARAGRDVITNPTDAVQAYTGMVYAVIAGMGAWLITSVSERKAELTQDKIETENDTRRVELWTGAYLEQARILTGFHHTPKTGGAA